MQSVADMSECHALVYARDELVRKDSDIGSAKLMGKIDETTRLVHVHGPLGRIGFVHLGGSAKVGNGETGGREIGQRAFQPSAVERGALRQVH